MTISDQTATMWALYKPQPRKLHEFYRLRWRNLKEVLVNEEGRRGGEGAKGGKGAKGEKLGHIARDRKKIKKGADEGIN